MVDINHFDPRWTFQRVRVEALRGMAGYISPERRENPKIEENANWDVSCEAGVGRGTPGFSVHGLSSVAQHQSRLRFYTRVGVGR